VRDRDIIRRRLGLIHDIRKEAAARQPKWDGPGFTRWDSLVVAAFSVVVVAIVLLT